MTDQYEAFIRNKSASKTFDGVEPSELTPALFPHQCDLVRWALRKGRAAIFAQTGLGKSLMELEWARHVSKRGRVLMLTPLMVAKQFEREAAKFGLSAKYMREDDGTTQIVVTNYEMLDRFDAGNFIGAVIDESSILKSMDGKTRTLIIDTFANTPYRLAATATPAPNDFTELGNHSQFLGIKSRTEMLAEYFVHDGETTQEWRLKGHATTAFWKWVATWAAIIQTPSDFGHDDGGYALPPLNMHERVLPLEVEDGWKAGNLFATEVRTLSDQRANRRATMPKRIAAAVEIAQAKAEPCIIWCELNAEQDAISEALGDDCVSIEGSMSHADKESRLERWLDGKVRTLVSKTSIFGFGLNLQCCARMVFMGASHSFEQTYQAIRRCWRFGQTRPVDVYVIRAENEGAIVQNYRRKEADAARMGSEMREYSRDAVRAEVLGSTGREWNEYNPKVVMKIPKWLRTEAL